MTDDELKQLFAKTDAQIAKTDAQIAKTDIQIAETNAQMAKTDAQMAKTDAKLERLCQLVGSISNNQGDIAEEFFFRSFEENPVLNGVRFDYVERNFRNRVGNIQDEYDIILINGHSLALIEVKVKAHIKDCIKLIERKVPNFPKLFKDYQGFHIYAGIATLVSHAELVETAKELGLFLFTQRGDHIEIVQEGREIIV